MADAKKEVVEVVKKFKAFEDFTVEKAQVVADFQKIEEFFTLCETSVRSPLRMALIGHSRSFMQLSSITIWE